MSKFFLPVILCFFQSAALAQAVLPIDTLNSTDVAKPLVLYISGDGGMNSFSTSFVEQLNHKGYPVVALNAKSYFWKTKQPATAAADMAALLNNFMVRWHRSEIILAGYSLGADVLPFIQARLPINLASGIRHTVLLSPSRTTDFTVHLFYNADGSSVPAEINKLSKPLLIIFGKEETDTPAVDITNKMATILTLPGDHHYNNQVSFLTTEILKRM